MDYNHINVDFGENPTALQAWLQKQYNHQGLDDFSYNHLKDLKQTGKVVRTAGAQAGAFLGGLTGPAVPVAIPILSLVGGIVGSFGGDWLGKYVVDITYVICRMMGGIVLGLFDPLFRFLLRKDPPVKYSEEDRSMVFCEETPKTLIGTLSTHTEYVFTSFCEGADEEVVPLAWELVKRLCADRAIATEIRLRQEGEKTNGNLAYCFPARCYRFLQAVHPERSICKCDDSRIFVLTQGFDPEPYALWKEFGISDDCWILYHIFPDSLPPENAEQAAQAVDRGQYDLRLALHEFGPRSLYVTLNNETVTFDSIQKIIKTVCRENHVPFHDQAP